MNVGISMVLQICGLVVATTVVLYIAAAVAGSSSWIVRVVVGVSEIALITGTIMFTVKTANEMLTRSIERQMQIKEKKV